MSAADVTKRPIVVLGNATNDVCGRCGDHVIEVAHGLYQHEDGTKLCGSRLAEIKRKPERLRHYYAGEVNGGMDVPREYAEALGLTTVIFRKWYRRCDGNGVIAIFPQDIDPATGMTQMFEHVGQHGRGDYVGTLTRTRAAKPHEYADLLAELESEPYNYRLDVKRRAPGPKRRR